jgi:hypothetical protein
VSKTKQVCAMKYSGYCATFAVANKAQVGDGAWSKNEERLVKRFPEVCSEARHSQ